MLVSYYIATVVHYCRFRNNETVRPTKIDTYGARITVIFPKTIPRTIFPKTEKDARCVQCQITAKYTFYYHC